MMLLKMALNVSSYDQLTPVPGNDPAVELLYLKTITGLSCPMNKIVLL